MGIVCLGYSEMCIDEVTLWVIVAAFCIVVFLVMCKLFLIDEHKYLKENFPDLTDEEIDDGLRRYG